MAVEAEGSRKKEENVRNALKEEQILMALILFQGMKIQSVKWKGVSVRRKRTDIVILKLINVTSTVVQESMNRNSGPKLQCVMKPAVKWTNASRKQINIAILKQAKMKLTQSVNRKAELETELIMTITQTVKARLTAVQEQAL